MGHLRKRLKYQQYLPEELQIPCSTSTRAGVYDPGAWDQTKLLTLRGEPRGEPLGGQSRRGGLRAAALPLGLPLQLHGRVSSQEDRVSARGCAGPCEGLNGHQLKDAR